MPTFELNQHEQLEATAMKSLVIYATRTGNTKRVAEAIATELARHGVADLVPIEQADPRPSIDVDLVVVGGPTERHGTTPEVVAFFDRLATNSLSRVRSAAFDTRLDWPRWLSGSAAELIAARLRRAGARLVLAPESFMVSREPVLELGELQRAAEWARNLAERVEPAFESVRPGRPELLEVKS